MKKEGICLEGKIYFTRVHAKSKLIEEALTLARRENLGENVYMASRNVHSTSRALRNIDGPGEKMLRIRRCPLTRRSLNP